MIWTSTLHICAAHQPAGTSPGSPFVCVYAVDGPPLFAPFPLPHQAVGVPFDPVYIDSATGAWMAPGFNYLEKRAPWQEYLDKKHGKKDYLTDEQLAEHNQQQVQKKAQQQQQQPEQQQQGEQQQQEQVQQQEQQQAPAH